MLVWTDICVAASVNSWLLGLSFAAGTIPARVLPGLPPPPCCTCVIKLAGPPAAAMTYVNESSGLEPSVYGGGGSPSSSPLPEDWPLVSEGRAALVSASTLVVARAAAGSIGGAGQNAGGGEESGSVMDASTRSGEVAVGKKSEEKGGGGSELVVDAAGAPDSCSVYRGSLSQGTAEEGKELLSDTDEPSLDSRVADNVMAVAR